MLFCEECNITTKDNRCPLCRRKKLREVRSEDYCFFVNLGEFYFKMFEDTLKRNNIDVIAVPYYPRGVSYASAGRASGRKVFIRHKDTENALEIYNTLFFANKS